jgi:hypothetical protein
MVEKPIEAEMEKVFNDLISEINFEALNFSNLIKFIDGNIGISIQKEYPEYIQKKIKVIGDEKFIALIQLRVQKDGDKGRHPIDIRCKFLHYNKEEKEFDWNFKNIKRKYFIPAEIFSSNEFYLDVREKKFLQNNRKDFSTIEGREIFVLIFKRHLNTLSYIKLIPSLIQKDFLKTVIDFCNILKYFFEFILKIIFGVIYKYDYLFDKYFPQDKYEVKKERKSESDDEKIVTFLGFKVSEHKLFLFSLFHLLIFILLKKNHYVKYFSKSSSSNVIILFYVIVAWIFFNRIIPSILKKSANILSFLAFKLKYKL